MHLGINDDWASNYYTSDEIDLAHRADLTILRFPIGWQSVQPDNPNQWNWSYMDRIMQAAAAAGEQVIFKPMGSPCWAHPSTECSSARTAVPPEPEYLGEWQRYVQEVIQRYPRIIAGVEVWNEPNQHPYWDAPIDPVRYTTILRATYQAVKSVAPRLPVVFGGLSPTTTNDGDHENYVRFLNRAFAAGAGGYFDALAFHPYVAPRSSPDFRTQMRSMMARVSEIAARNGEPGIPIWVTEFGYPVSTKLSAEAQAARILASLHTLARVPRVPVVIVHRMFDQPGDGVEAGYGLIEADGRTPKPAYCALLARADTSCDAR